MLHQRYAEGVESFANKSVTVRIRRVPAGEVCYGKNKTSARRRGLLRWNYLEELDALRFPRGNRSVRLVFNVCVCLCVGGVGGGGCGGGYIGRCVFGMGGRGVCHPTPPFCRLYFSVSIRLSVSVSVSLSVSLSLSLCLFVCLSVCLSLFTPLYTCFR